MSDTIQFTEDQTKILDGLKAWFDSNQNQAVLTGPAGSGKTFVSSQFITDLKVKVNAKIAITAPTHKALKVISNMCEEKGIRDGISFCTLHSLLGLRKVVDGFGNEKFKREKGRKGKDVSTDYDIVICDEASMVSSDLFNYIKDEVKILLIGDHFQLPPVNEKISPVFTEKFLKFELTEIVRQAKGNRIIGFSKSIRESKGISSVKDFMDADDIVMLKYNKMEKFVDFIFRTDEYAQDGNAYKILCYTNREVAKWNSLIRSRLYPNSKEKVEIGEKLIFRRPAQHPDDPKVFSFDTNDEITILNTDIVDVVEDRTSSLLKVYKCEGRDENFGRVGEFHILHPDSYSDYEIIYSDLEKIAKGCQQGTNEARKAWIALYDFRDSFAFVQGAAACTVHVSQGSTFKKCFVICKDFDRCKRPDEKVQLFYTAVTRASDKLCLVMGQ